MRPEGHVTIFLRAGVTAVALAASIACSNSSTSPSQVNSGSSSQASFSVGVRPNPITATHCSPQCPSDSGSSFAFSVAMTIDVQDSASVGATVNSITLTANASGTALTPLVISADDLKQQNGTNHVDSHGTLSTPLSIVYNTPSGSPNLDISISAQITDDRSSQVTATGQVTVR
jgi:hypothetical protein